jgi:tetratricopeptide (TPR) repeat protein
VFLFLAAGPAQADVAEDLRVCLDGGQPAPLRMESCTRLIEDPTAEGIDLVQVNLARGEARFDARAYDEALADFDRVIALAPELERGWGGRGEALVALGRYEEALDPLARAIEMAPGEYWYFNRRGVALYNLDRFDEAIASLSRALELNPASVDSLFYRGAVHLAQDRFALAIEDFDAALAIAPFDVQIRELRGQSHLFAGNSSEAIRDLRTAILFDPNVPYAGILLGDAAPAAPPPEKGGPMVYEPPEEGLRITYVQVVNEPFEVGIAEEIGGLLGTITYPLPIERRFVRRDIGATVEETTRVTVTDLFGGGPVEEIDYVRSLWLDIVPAPAPGGPELEIAYDAGTIDFWQMAPGGTTAGTGAIVLTCPTAPNPLALVLGCTPGVDSVRLGEVQWTAVFDGWEVVTVPAGQRLAARVATTETRTLTIAGRSVPMTAVATWWFDPEIDWWIKRELTQGERIQIDEAWEIERPAP